MSITLTIPFVGHKDEFHNESLFKHVSPISAPIWRLSSRGQKVWNCTNPQVDQTTQQNKRAETRRRHAHDEKRVKLGGTLHTRTLTPRRFPSFGIWPITEHHPGEIWPMREEDGGHMICWRTHITYVYQTVRVEKRTRMNRREERLITLKVTAGLDQGEKKKDRKKERGR